MQSSSRQRSTYNFWVPPGRLYESAVPIATGTPEPPTPTRAATRTGPSTTPLRASIPKRPPPLPLSSQRTTSTARPSTTIAASASLPAVADISSPNTQAQPRWNLEEYNTTRSSILPLSAGTSAGSSRPTAQQWQAMLSSSPSVPPVITTTDGNETISTSSVLSFSSTYPITTSISLVQSASKAAGKPVGRPSPPIPVHTRPVPISPLPLQGTQSSPSTLSSSPSVGPSSVTPKPSLPQQEEQEFREEQAHLQQEHETEDAGKKESEEAGRQEESAEKEKQKKDDRQDEMQRKLHAEEESRLQHGPEILELQRRHDEEVKRREEKLKGMERELRRREEELERTRKEEILQRKEAELRKREEAIREKEAELIRKREERLKHEQEVAEPKPSPIKPHLSSSIASSSSPQNRKVDQKKREKARDEQKERETALARQKAEEERGHEENRRREEEHQREEQKLRAKEEDRLRREQEDEEAATALAAAVEAKRLENERVEAERIKKQRLKKELMRQEAVALEEINRKRIYMGHKQSEDEQRQAQVRRDREEAIRLQREEEDRQAQWQEQKRRYEEEQRLHRNSGAGEERRQEEELRRQEERIRQENDRLTEMFKAKQPTRQMSTNMPKRYSDAWEAYNARWSSLLSSAQSEERPVLTFAKVPWPTLNPPSGPEAINRNAVGSFILSQWHSKEKSRRNRIREALRRWHPDHFESRYLSMVPEGEERENVKAGVGNILRLLQELLKPETLSDEQREMEAALTLQQAENERPHEEESRRKEERQRQVERQGREEGLHTKEARHPTEEDERLQCKQADEEVVKTLETHDEEGKRKKDILNESRNKEEHWEMESQEKLLESHPDVAPKFGSLDQHRIISNDHVTKEPFLVGPSVAETYPQVPPISSSSVTSHNDPSTFLPTFSILQSIIVEPEGINEQHTPNDVQVETVNETGLSRTEVLALFNSPNHPQLAIVADGEQESVRHLKAELGDTTTETTESNALQEESPDLKSLMEERPPRNLTSQVTIDFTVRPERGGFALVYQGIYDGMKVAVKETTIKVRPLRQVSLRRRVDREISVWAALHHENILELLGYAEGYGDHPAPISPWCDNGTAEDYLRKNVSIHKRFSLAQDVANGLQYLHSLKIIHGDLKPRNILISDNEVALLCDFGLVALQDWQGPKGMTTTSPYSATALYTAPELFEPKDNNHLRATCPGDIYALGCVIFEFVEAQDPYGHMDYWEISRAKRKAEMPARRPPNEEGKEFQRHFWNLLEECWDSEPDSRPTSTEALHGLTYISNLLPLQPAT